tara:strand:+ start:223 stop:855 length:633 start_codon:yes stop_codon:yes gene_type:complete
MKLYGRERICASFMDTKEPGKTLNIGAGEVLWIENFLFKNNKNLISSDLDPKNLTEKNKAKTKKIIDAESIALPSNTINQVIILDVLEHLKQDNKAVKEIHRILKKSGKLVVCVPNDTLLSYLNPVRYVQHERHYSISHISNILKNNGFKIKKIHAGGGIFELMNLYTHFLIKYTTGKIINPKFFDKLRDNEYKTHRKSGNEIAILAIKE